MNENNDFDDFVGYVAMVNEPISTSKQGNGCGCLVTIALILLLILCFVSTGY